MYENFLSLIIFVKAIDYNYNFINIIKVIKIKFQYF